MDPCEEERLGEVLAILDMSKHPEVDVRAYPGEELPEICHLYLVEPTDPENEMLLMVSTPGALVWRELMDWLRTIVPAEIMLPRVNLTFHREPVVHRVGYASQPDIQISCTGVWSTPSWQRRDMEALPKGVYLSADGHQYTFDRESVTCEKCREAQLWYQL